MVMEPGSGPGMVNDILEKSIVLFPEAPSPVVPGLILLIDKQNTLILEITGKHHSRSQAQSCASCARDDMIMVWCQSLRRC